MKTISADEPSRYIEGAVISGVSAHVLDRILAAPDVVRLLRSLPAWMQGDLDATRRAIARAAAEYVALPVAVDGSAATDVVEAARVLPHEIDTAEAAVLLGVTERRVRQLAAEGMGRRVRGRWLLDRGLVAAYARRRRVDP